MDDIARFGAYLSDEKHSSRNTVSSYLRDTTQFAEYLHNYCDIDLREADSAAVQDYMDWMLSHGKSAASVTRFLASVKSFYSYMVAAGELKKNPAQGVASAKVERKYPEILTAKEVELFLEQPEGLHIIVLHGGGQAGRPAYRLGQIRQKGNPSAGPGEGRRQVHQQHKRRKASRKTAKGGP